MSAQRRSSTKHWQLIELRVNEGMSPNDLAYRAGVSGNTVRLAEAGWRPGPRVQHAISGVFKLKPTDLWPLARGAR